jgi:formate dehydrogenase iron-sulfur subunit
MALHRRTFLKACGATAGAVLLPYGGAMAAPPMRAPGTNPSGMLSDLTKCIGCGWCQEACREWNNLPTEKNEGLKGDGSQPYLSADTWTLPELYQIEQGGEVHQVFVKRQCMHCVNPACVSACPVGALQKLDNGAVTYDYRRCIGCRYCMVACPFSIPKFEWDQPLPRIRKCTLCADRQEMGLEPACATACPTGALKFGDRDVLIAEAEARIQAEPESYFPHIYGKEELGGTSWMYLSPVSFEELDFPTLKTEPVTELSETVATYGSAGVAASVTFLLGGLYYWFHRRENSIQLGGMADEERREVES